MEDNANSPIIYDKNHIQKPTIDRANNPQRRSTCFGFYC